MNSCVFTIDVEDWFHILDLPGSPPVNEWPNLPSRVEANFMRMLEILAEHGAKATCFFLGWIGERFPHLVTAAANAGHEIASHGWSHQLVYSMSRESFREDAVRSRLFLEDLSGQEVIGYRAPGFSYNGATLWFFEELANAGYRYDTSIFPARRGHGGLPGARLETHIISTPSGDVVEFPATLVDVAGVRLCFFGGGYLRLFPWGVVRLMTRQVLRTKRPVVFYLHPREIDPDHPRLRMTPWRRFKSYVNLSSTEGKTHRLLEEFPLTTFRHQMNMYLSSQLANELDPQAAMGQRTVISG